MFDKLQTCSSKAFIHLPVKPTVDKSFLSPPVSDLCPASFTASFSFLNQNQMHSHTIRCPLSTTFTALCTCKSTCMFAFVYEVEGI